MAVSRLIVGITGASGAAYGVAALKALRAAGIETHLVISKSGQITTSHELAMSLTDVAALADVVYKIGDVAAAISSGSFQTTGMLVAPCSIRTLSEIASGVTSSLLTRAADVVHPTRRLFCGGLRGEPARARQLPLGSSTRNSPAALI